MKITYLANVRIPTEKAHGLQIMQMCAAFASLGHEITLVVPDRKNPIEEDAFYYYGLEPTFRILKVPVFDWIRFSRWLGPLAVLLLEISYARAARKALRNIDADIIYSRDTFFTLWAPEGPVRILELHTRPKSFRRFYASAWKLADRIVTVTRGLKEDLAAIGVPEDRLRVAEDAVDLRRFREDGMSKRQAREALGLPQERIVGVYVGRFYPEQGVGTLSQACDRLSSDALVVMVGGKLTEGDGPRRKVQGRVPPSDIPKWLKAADFGLMPYVGTSEHISRYASPMKLFEYLAAGLPVIASDLPSVREVLTEEEAVLVAPDDPEALAGAIDALSEDVGRRHRLSESAGRLAAGKTWTSRAQGVLEGAVRVAGARKGWMRWWPEVLILSLALLLRCAFVGLLPQAPLADSDATLYLGYADWMRGASEWDPLWYPSFQIGYPAFLSFVRAVLGESLLVLRLVQAVLGTATVGIVMWMGHRWGNRSISLVAGLILALHAPSVLQTGVVHTEGLYAFVLTLAAGLLLLAVRSDTWVSGVIVGVAVALSGAVREVGYYWGIILSVFALWKRAFRTAVLVFTCVTVAALSTAPILIATVPDKRAEESGALISKGYEQTILDDETFMGYVLDRERILMWPEGIMRFLLVPYRLIDLSGGISMKRIIVERDFSAARISAPEIFVKAIVYAIHMLIIGFGIVGLFRKGVDKDLKILMVLTGLFFGGAVVVASVGFRDGFAAFAPLSRYRFPLMPLIILIAASGIMSFGHPSHGKR